MAPILYYIEMSPPVRAVFLTAAEIGLELDLKYVSLITGEHFSPKYLKMNPQHTVPTMDDNGFIIWDSHAIAAYLVSKYAKDDSLYPKDLTKRAVVDQRLHFDSGTLFPRLRAILFPIMNQGKTVIDEKDKEAMLEAYSFTESLLKDHKYLAGDQLTIADFCAIATLSTIVPIIPYDVAKFPNLTAWIARMKELPYYQEKCGHGSDRVALKTKECLGKL